MIYKQLCLIHSFVGKLTENTPSTVRATPKQAAVTLPQPTTTTTGSKQSRTEEQQTTTQQVTTTSTKSVLTTTQEAMRKLTKTTPQPNKMERLGRNTSSPTIQSSSTGKIFIYFTTILASFILDDLKLNYVCSWNFFTGRLWKRLQRREHSEALFHGKWGGSCVG